ncbi:MAG: glucose-6-phosphate isomerase [Myxococcales bacterium]|nr:glucose-6-phosphate isomerase [Myxococcales bacterium]
MPDLPDAAFFDPALGFSIDLRHMAMSAADFDALVPRFQAAFAAMAELEGGAIANADEQRMVGHYWLRDASLAPQPELRQAIAKTQTEVKEVAADLRSRFDDAVIIGIGGSSLGPLLVYEALGRGEGGLRLHFLDNTDPDGIDLVLTSLDLDRTVCVVISKSGGTKETRNGMLEAKAAYDAAGLSFGAHAFAVTGEGSQLDTYSRQEGFIGRLPMWDWVGGRTSVTAAVGQLPAALQNADVDALLAGAAAMDRLTRAGDPRQNPAALLAAAWHVAGEGRGRRAMVMLPYKDRLTLVSRYLQQLVMESLGKELDRQGNTVHQGIAVYGNKGSTDQHAYVQQLYEGPDDFFVTFIEVLEDRDGASLEVEPGVTSGDYLSGFLQGTRRALADRGRRSLTLTFDRLDARSLGALIALYERAVGLYAELVDINAYHQPAVESGKRAAAEVLAVQAKLLAALGPEAATPDDWATRLDLDTETVASVLRHLAANGRVSAERLAGEAPWRWRYRAV